MWMKNNNENTVNLGTFLLFNETINYLFESVFEKKPKKKTYINKIFKKGL